MQSITTCISTIYYQKRKDKERMHIIKATPQVDDQTNFTVLVENPDAAREWLLTNGFTPTNVKAGEPVSWFRNGPTRVTFRKGFSGTTDAKEMKNEFGFTAQVLTVPAPERTLCFSDSVICESVEE
jgi:hypothetical protein